MDEYAKTRLEKLSQFYQAEEGGFLDFDATLQRLRYRAFREQFRGRSCLEVAPARGITTRLLKDDFDTVDVVEGSETLLNDIPDFEHLRKFHCMVEEFEPDRRYDTIVMDHILEHIRHPVKCLQRVRGWLAPGGVLIVGVPNAQSFHRQAGVKMGLLSSVYELNQRDRELGHFRVYDFKTLRQDVEAAGWKVVGEDGVFLKFLTNRQCQDYLDEQQVEAYFQLSRQYKELAGEIFVYCVDVLLKGHRTELVPVSPDDAEDILSLRNDPDYNRYLSHPGRAISLENQRRWLSEHFLREDEKNFKILLDGRFVGTISLCDIQGKRAEFGRYLAKNPLASLEAVLLLLRYGFEGLHLDEIFCRTLEANSKVWGQHTRFGFEEKVREMHPELGEPVVHQVMTRQNYEKKPFREIEKLIERFC